MILGILICAGMIWAFWELSNWSMVVVIPGLSWTVRALAIVPLATMLFFASCVLGTSGWLYRWDGKSDGTDSATKQMKKAFKNQTGKDFPE
jgi:uncharacterized membrane-anchored protein YitT (DUF2179 family)